MKRKRRQSSSTRTDFDLPDDCWEHIFKFVVDDDDDCGNNNHHHFLENLTLVSKRFLSITNNIKFSFTFPRDPTHIPLTCCFHRFTNLASLNLKSCHEAHLSNLLCQISRFPIHLKSLTNNINLNGLETLLSALFKLRKVNLTRHYYINDQLLFHLFKNCQHLEEVIILGCYRITNDGIVYALRERPTLTSLSFTNLFNLDNCAKLFALVRNCASLSTIKMVNYSVPENTVDNSNSLIDFVLSPQIKSLLLPLSSCMVNR